MRQKSPKTTHRVITLLTFLLTLLVAEKGIAVTATADMVVVLKSQRMLQIHRNGSVIKSYQVALGQDPLGHKTRKGDKKTPEGTYLLDWRTPRSEFYKAIHISYPNETDRMRARRDGVTPGGDIMIHGLPRGKEIVGELHSVIDWTRGCIAVTNEEMDEIWELVPDGTPIEIRP